MESICTWQTFLPWSSSNYGQCSNFTEIRWCIHPLLSVVISTNSQIVCHQRSPIAGYWLMDEGWPNVGHRTCDRDRLRMLINVINGPAANGTMANRWDLMWAVVFAYPVGRRHVQVLNGAPRSSRNQCHLMISAGHHHHHHHHTPPSPPAPLNVHQHHRSGICQRMTIISWNLIASWDSQGCYSVCPKVMYRDKCITLNICALRRGYCRHDVIDGQQTFGVKSHQYHFTRKPLNKQIRRIRLF